MEVGSRRSHFLIEARASIRTNAVYTSASGILQILLSILWRNHAIDHLINTILMLLLISSNISTHNVSIGCTTS